MKKCVLQPPDKLYEWVVSRLSKREIKLFVATCIMGFGIHYLLYSQQLTNPDGRWFGGAYNYKSTYWEVALGRWGLYLIDSTRGFLTSPFLTCAISIVVMSFAAIFLIRTIKIEGKINSVIIMMAMISMPCFSYTLSYWYCADAYAWSMLFSILAVYFTNRGGRFNRIIGIICLAIMLGLYQAYICVTVGLCIICLFVSLYDDKYITITTWWNKVKMFLFMGVMGIATYWGILQIALKLWETDISSYSGANEIGILNSIIHLPDRIIHAYYVIGEWMFGNEIILNTYWKREYIYSIVLLLFIIFLCVINQRAQRMRIFFGMTCVVLFPVGVGFIEIIAPERNINILLSCGMSLIIPFFLKITEMTDKEYLLKYAATVLSLLLVWSYILSDNATYLAVQTTTRQTETILREIHSRAQCLDTFKIGNKFMFAGIIDHNLYKRDAKIYRMSYGLWSDMNSFWNTYEGARSNWFFLYFDLLGMKLNLCTDEEYLRIVNSEEFSAMPLFPTEGSVSMIDGIVCVKMSEIPPMP